MGYFGVEEGIESKHVGFKVGKGIESVDTSTHKRVAGFHTHP